jgi:CelD/BcsL family acetyltransferase involved in cellulose biosynthesis
MIFHHPAWIELLARHYRYEISVVGIERAGRLVAGLPVALVASRLTGRRLVALPFSDLCPPLLATDAEDEQPALLAALSTHRRAAGLPLEVRDSLPTLEGATTAPLFHLHVIDLDEEPRFSSMTRRNVAKARRAGVTVVRRTDRAALDAFYALHLATRRRQGVPTQPRSFIRDFERLFSQGLGFVALAELDGTVASAAVFLGTGRTLTYKYGASDRSLLASRPNNVLFAEIIGWARAAGYAHLDLGRTDLGHEGLRAFKASWGAREEVLSYTYAGRSAPAAGPGRSDRALAAVITRTPPQVGRWIGAALYRHAG